MDRQGELREVEDSINRLRCVQDRLSDDFVDKLEIVEMMLLCAVSQEPMVIFGEPGTAKSALISRFCEYVGLPAESYFKYLLTLFTEPDELLGVVDIQAYMDDKEYRRIEKGGIQKAKIAFLDEVFHANSAILNTLLSIINERIYYEGGRGKPANTQVVYGASNTPPTSPDLRAFYARFPIRVRSRRVSETHPLQLLERGWILECEELEHRSKPPQERADDQTVNEKALCEADDLEKCQEWLRVFWAPGGNAWSDTSSYLQELKPVYFEIIRLMNEAPEQFQIDDRKAVKLFKLILARALLRPDGGPTKLPTLTDVQHVLRHTWEDPELAGLAMENLERHVRAANLRHGSALGPLALDADPETGSSNGGIA